MMDPTEDDLIPKEKPTHDDVFCEEDVEFVSEGPSRPVVDCIDLVSDDESQAVYQNRKDPIDATFERLARYIEEEKRKEAEKKKAFQDKINFQRAEGLQKVALFKDNPNASAAKFCVRQWLNMPGLRPGSVSSSRRTFSQPREVTPMKTEPITCPVIRCNRSFDNRQLLLGHLKRFDHSPCDPTIYLRGGCKDSYICLVCQNRFATLPEYSLHLEEKVKMADGHQQNLAPLAMHCFACPSCFCFFNQQDECLKHMSSNNHFVRSIRLNGQKGVPYPIPIPTYSMRVLIALCEDIPFQVVCTSCRCELRSYVELTAHFRTRCRNACPASLSEKSVADVASVFKLKAFCLTCKRGLSDEAHIAKHITRTSHSVKQITSIEESILAFCYLFKGTKTPHDFCLSASNARKKLCTLKRSFHDSDDSHILEKHVTKTEGGVKKEDVMITAWFCECAQQFSDEEAVEKHIVKANRISYKCLVCSKLADEGSIIRLHMCRFHGGARLDSYLLWCQVCKTELARIENALQHIKDCHAGHSYYYELDVPEEQPNSSEVEMSTPSVADMTPEITERDLSPQQSATGLWQCHICEDMFDTEDTVIQHCRSLSLHQFHKYCCDTCKKKFHKIETLLRHCELQHSGDIHIKYFCGLCEDLYFEEESAFFGHYESFHSLDYIFIPNQEQSDIKTSHMAPTVCKESEKQLTCGCFEKYSLKQKRKEDSKLCLERLFGKGKLWYSCCSCPATAQTFEAINTHICRTVEQASSIKCVIKCSICSKSFDDPDSAQSHYHMKHCFLKEPSESYNFKTNDSKADVSAGCSASSTKAPAKPTNIHARPLYSEVQDAAHTTSNGLPSIKIKSETETMEIQNTDSGLQDLELPDLDLLCTMNHIIFINLDHRAQFISNLPGFLNHGTFVWAFQGEKSKWKPPLDKFFRNLSISGSFWLHPHCSDGKDAADVAIFLHAGRLDEQLPQHIPFTILSGDNGLTELERKKPQRSVHILNPHTDGDVMSAFLNNIADIVQEKSDDDMEINSLENIDDAEFEEALRRSLLEM